MKGKKADSNFVSSFIEDCIGRSIYLTDDILNSARDKIAEIDSKIKEVEELKKLRPKLLDVVDTLSEKSKNVNNPNILNLFKVKDKNLSKTICDLVKVQPVNENLVKSIGVAVEDINFCIKQLIDLKVLNKNGKFISKGEMFSIYLEKVFIE